MRTLKDSINESRVNEAAIPALVKKLKLNVETAEIDMEGYGYVLGDGFDYYDKGTEKTFDENLKEILRVFKKVNMSGEIVTKPISMKEALSYAEDNGEEPEGTMYFVFVEDFDEPTIYTDLLIRW